MAKWTTLGLIVLAFVAGSASMGIMVDAAEKPNGQPFQALWDTIGLLNDRISGLEDKRFSEFSGSLFLIDNRASNVLTIECNSDYPYYQYDSGFTRSRTDATLMTVSEDIVWDGDKMASITNYVVFSQDMSISKSIVCSNLP
jgi:hypothetical protein